MATPDSVDRRADSVDRETDSEDRKADSVDRKADSVERKAGSSDRKAGTLEKKTGTLERKAGTLERKTGTLERKTGTLERKRRKTGLFGNHRKGFDQFRGELLRLQLDTGVVDCLVSRLVLSIEDADTIRETKGQTNRNKCLLSILQERPYNTFDIFAEALYTADPIQHGLVTRMRSFEVVQTKKKDVKPVLEIEDFYVRFQKNYRTLVNQIASPLKIVDVLIELEVFNTEDIEDFSPLQNISNQNRKLLSKIADKGEIGYTSFLRALRRSDDFHDRELASDIERTAVSHDDKLCLHIGIILSQEKNIPSNIRDITKQFEEEDALFIETKGTRRVMKAAHENNCITIVGSSGSGKTSLMKHVALKFKYEKGYDVYSVESPDKIIEYRDKDAKQIFITDDTLGTYAISPFLVEKWERLHNQIQYFLNDNPGNMKLLFTLRKQLVNDKKFTNCSSIITKNIVDLEDKSIALSKKEKKQMLTKHLNVENIDSSITKEDVNRACVSDYAFPLLCKIVSINEEIRTNIAKFFREPFSVLEKELRKLSEKNPEVYCSLVLCMLLNGKIGEDFFDLNSPQQTMFSTVAEACGLSKNVSRTVIENGLKSVIGTYVRSENGSFSFMHDVFKESISYNFAKLNPDVMFKFCEIALIRDRVRIKSRLSDDDENVIIIDKNKFDVITKRILTECEEGRFSNVLLSHVIKSEDFVEYLGNKLKHGGHAAINKFVEKVSVERQINKWTVAYFVNCFFKVCCRACCKSEKVEHIKNDKIDVDNAALKQVIRAPPRQSTLFHWVVACGCSAFFKFLWANVSKTKQKDLLSRDWKYPLTKPFLPLAVLGGNIDIIKELTSSGADLNCFSYEGETPLTMTAMSDRDDIAAFLITEGADVNHPDLLSHKFPSFICIEKENVKVLEQLLKNQCDFNLEAIYGRSSTILKALMMMKQTIVEMILKHDCKDYPLHAAILNCDVQCIQTKLGNESINSKTRNGLTPLHYAALVKNVAVIRLLFGDDGDDQPTDQFVKANSSQKSHLIRSMLAEIDSQNKNGLTPLHVAVLNNHVEAVQLLLKKNADKTVKDHFGRIPLHYSQDPNISAMLLNGRISKSVLLSLPHNCPVARDNQSEDVIIEIDNEPIEYQRNSSWGNGIRDAAWHLLPFRKCIYRGSIHQTDHQRNTVLHVILETMRDLNSNIRENSESAANIKLLLKHGAKIHLRNDKGCSPVDIVHERKDLLKLFNFSPSRSIACTLILTLLAIICCFGFVCHPISLAISNILNEFNITDSTNLSKLDKDELKTLERGSKDLLMYHYFLIYIVLHMLTCIQIIHIAIQVWNSPRRYLNLCLVLFVMVQSCTVLLLFVYDKTFTNGRFFYMFLSSILNVCHLGFVSSIKAIFSLKIKIMHPICFMYILIFTCIYLLPVFVFMKEPTVNNDTTSILNITLSDVSGNVKTEDFRSLDYTTLYIVSIFIGFYIFWDSRRNFYMCWSMPEFPSLQYDNCSFKSEIVYFQFDLFVHFILYIVCSVVSVLIYSANMGKITYYIIKYIP